MKSTSYPGLDVKLSVGGAAMQEYEDENSEVPTAENAQGWRNSSTFVEAASGANFKIELRVDDQYQFRRDDLQVDVYLDGRLAQGIGKCVTNRASSLLSVWGSTDLVLQLCLVLSSHRLRTMDLESFEGSMITLNGQTFMRNYAFAELKTSRCANMMGCGIHS